MCLRVDLYTPDDPGNCAYVCVWCVCVRACVCVCARVCVCAYGEKVEIAKRVGSEEEGSACECCEGSVPNTPASLQLLTV